MSIQEMHNWFELLLDKYNAPQFTSAEIDLFLQRAEVYIVNDYFLNRFEKLGENFNQIPNIISSSESRSTDAMILKPLMSKPIVFTTSGSGVVTDSDIEAILGKKYLHILSSKVGDIPAKLVRHNDFFKHEMNSFKKAKEDRPKMRIFNNYIKFDPESKSEVTMIFLVEPSKVFLDVDGDNSIESDLPDSIHNEVVAKAVELAGIANRDDALRTITTG